MANKKTPGTDSVKVEPIVDAPAPPKPKEKLITVTTPVWFSDGNLKEYMAQYGYPCEWLAGESRNLPKWLIQRCLNSGAEFEELG